MTTDIRVDTGITQHPIFFELKKKGKQIGVQQIRCGHSGDLEKASSDRAGAAWTRFSSCRLAAAVSHKPSSPPDKEHPGKEEDGKASEDEEEALGGEKDKDCSRQ